MKKNRYLYLDLARDIIILSLPLIHVIEFLGYEMGYANILSVSSVEILSVITSILTIFVAPLFMIFMGMNMIFTNKKTPKDFIKRGFFMIIMEIVLNVIRYGIPGLIATGLTNNIVLKKEIIDLTIYAQINSDILMFSGLAFILFGLFKKMKMNENKILITTIIISFMGELFSLCFSNLLDISLNINIANFLGNFIYINSDSTFPLVEWMIFPAVGMVFGKKIVDTKSKKNVLNKTGIISLVVVFTYILILLITKVDIMKNVNAAVNNNHMTIPITLFEIFVSLLFIYIIYCINNKLKIEKNEKMTKIITNFSKNITYYYIIQWIIVGWIMLISEGLEIWNTQFISLPVTIFIIILIMTLSSILSKVMRRIKEKEV